MLNLPVYLRNSSYYFHTRIHGKQIKRSLHTADRQVAIIRACKLLEGIQMSIDLNNIKKYELDLSRGIAKSDGPEDHQRLMEAMAFLRESQNQSQKQPPVLESTVKLASSSTKSLTLLELLDKYFLLKKVKPATILAHKNTVKEFETFFKLKCYISEIQVGDITRFQEFLAGKGNVPRTIDGKIGYIKALLNFAIKQGYLLNQKNPAENMSLMTKRQKLSDGYLIFEAEEIKQIFTSEYYKEQKQSDPDYYYVLLLGLITGCRISEITTLTKSQFQISEKYTYMVVIRDSKTSAGKREVPLPHQFFDEDFKKFVSSKEDFIFKYVSRVGKGSGNAVGKKIARHLAELKINRGKLVFHSLRKFLNDYFMKNEVAYEPRCQFFGHEIESVNVATYSNKFSVDRLGEIVIQQQLKLLRMTKIIPEYENFIKIPQSE
ncbi:phage integrase SAM-like domain-containing protein [Undibacterium jejuense]|uniref:Phage integrase SAM-like domain-containing protein n=1 Tax=Undibacterium jejuense TaxID=1344949 RepID=A0A923HGZ5_9BURK|nr:phage integrase SAM-like domain-containing protein [Undibacterium jejuense]MBC3864337.1 phage integrase SAM-like domain-containing protein [Undibacterium jejuense]